LSGLSREPPIVRFATVESVWRSLGMNQTQNMSHETAFAVGLMLDATNNQCKLEMDLYFRE